MKGDLVSRIEHILSPDSSNFSIMFALSTFLDPSKRKYLNKASNLQLKSQTMHYLNAKVGGNDIVLVPNDSKRPESFWNLNDIAEYDTTDIEEVNL